MDDAHEAVGTMGISKTPFPGKLGKIGLPAKQGTSLHGGILIRQRQNTETSRTRCSCKLVPEDASRWVFSCTEADVFKATMARKRRVKAAIGNVLTKRLIGQSQPEAGCMVAGASRHGRVN